MFILIDKKIITILHIKSSLIWIYEQHFLIQVRVNCLLCLGKLLETMDKWFVLDEVLPLLPQIPTREPAVLMSILGKIT